MKGSTSAGHRPAIIEAVLAAVAAIGVLIFAVGSGTYLISFTLKGQPLAGVTSGLLATFGFLVARAGFGSATRQLFVWALFIGLGIEWAIGIALVALQRAKPDYAVLGFLLTSAALMIMWRLTRPTN